MNIKLKIRHRFCFFYSRINIECGRVFTHNKKKYSTPHRFNQIELDQINFNIRYDKFMILLERSDRYLNEKRLNP